MSFLDGVLRLQVVKETIFGDVRLFADFTDELRFSWFRFSLVVNVFVVLISIHGTIEAHSTIVTLERTFGCIMSRQVPIVDR